MSHHPTAILAIDYEAAKKDYNLKEITGFSSIDGSSPDTELEPKATIVKIDDYRILNSLINDTYVIARRGRLEEDASKRQILPYLRISDKAFGEPGRKLLNYTRLKGGGEKKLYGNKSIGGGGHVDMLPDVAVFNDDAAFYSVLAIDNNIKQELREEFAYSENGIVVPLNENIIEKIKFSGALIVDYSNDVGTKHIALVFDVILKEGINIDNIITNEPDQIEMNKARTIDDLYAEMKTGEVQWEAWSRCLVDWEYRHNRLLEQSKYEEIDLATLMGSVPAKLIGEVASAIRLLVDKTRHALVFLKEEDCEASRRGDECVFIVQDEETLDGAKQRAVKWLVNMYHQTNRNAGQDLPTPSPLEELRADPRILSLLEGTNETDRGFFIHIPEPHDTVLGNVRAVLCSMNRQYVYMYETKDDVPSHLKELDCVFVREDGEELLAWRDRALVGLREKAAEPNRMYGTSEIPTTSTERGQTTTTLAVDDAAHASVVESVTETIPKTLETIHEQVVQIRERTDVMVTPVGSTQLPFDDPKYMVWMELFERNPSMENLERVGDGTYVSKLPVVGAWVCNSEEVLTEEMRITENVFVRQEGETFDDAKARAEAWMTEKEKARVLAAVQKTPEVTQVDAEQGRGRGEIIASAGVQVIEEDGSSPVAAENGNPTASQETIGENEAKEQ